MPFAIVNRENETCLRLEGRLGVSEVSALYNDLCPHLDEDRRVIVDVADCERIDTSIVQLLYALKRKLPEMRIVNWSGGFRESLARVGQIRELQEVEEESGE